MLNIRKQLQEEGVPSLCLDPVNANGIRLRADGPHPGRLLFTATHNAYEGDIIVWTDDGGSHW
eukprot:COSAG05_NODE_11135_length_529_cov_0.711628_1_plen_63_part_00